MRKFIVLLFSLSLLTALLIGFATEASAVKKEDYVLWVGGVQVTEENASDVLGDGTVSYDAANKILTLQNADITEYHTVKIMQDDNYIGIYSEVDGLTINLVGENTITTRHSDSDMPDGSEVAIVSMKNINLSGEGRLIVKAAFSGIACLQNVTVEDCEFSCEWMGISSMGDVTVNGAALSAKMILIGVETGDITLKNTTVTEGGQVMSMFTEMGDITIEDSDITAHCNAPEEDETQCITVGQGNLTVKNTKLDLSAKMFTAFVNGKVVFEDVCGDIAVRGEAGYAIYAAADIDMTGCDLNFSCRATDDASGAICSAADDITITDSRLTMDVRAADDYAVAIGFPETDGGGTISIQNSTLDISVTGPIAAGIVSDNVRLVDCMTKIEAAADPNKDGAAMGVFATGGRIVINGGALDVIATGPLNGEPQTCGILMQNALLGPELIGADVKLRSNIAICAEPDLSLYGSAYEIVASPNLNGSEPVAYNKNDITSYQYLHIHSLHTITFDANGGTGDMEDILDFYGTYALPENSFTAPEGKRFKGWALTADGEILSESNVTVMTDTVLFALWEDIPHEHDFGGEWKNNAEVHWKECACGETSFSGPHADGNADDDCDDCGYDLHVHDFRTGWRSDVERHWQECTCGEKTLLGAHADGNTDGRCDSCGYFVGIPHAHDFVMHSDAEQHWKECTCGEKTLLGAHADENTDGRCDSCGYFVGIPHAHDFVMHSDAEQHWKECTCGEKTLLGAHADENTDGSCDVCEYFVGIPHTHDFGTAWASDAERHWKACACGEKSMLMAHVDNNANGGCDICGSAIGGEQNDPDPEQSGTEQGGETNVEKKSVGAGAIVLIMLGSVAILGGGGFAIFWFVIRKKIC